MKKSANHFSSFVIRFSSFVIRFSLFVIRFSLFVIRYSLLTQKGFIKISKNLIVMYLILFFAFSTIAGLFLFNPFGTTTAEAAWFNDNWAYRQEVPITANAAADTNAFFSFTLDTATLITAGQLQSSCQDIRVTDQNGNLLQYHIGRTNACNNAATTIDALAPYAANSSTPTLPVGASTFYVYYGNPSVPSKDIGANFTQSEAASYTVGTLGSEVKAPSPALYLKFDDSTTNIYNSGFAGTGGITYIQSQATQSDQNSSESESTICISSAAGQGCDIGDGAPDPDIIFDQPPTTGNLLVVAVACYNSGPVSNAVTDNQGNTYTQILTRTYTGTNVTLGLFYSNDIASSGTFTVTLNCDGGAGGDDMALAVHEYSGALDGGSVLDQSTSAENTDTATHSSGNVTTSTGGELYFGAMAETGDNTMSAGTEYNLRETLEDNSDTQGLISEDKIAPAGTHAATFGLTGGTNQSAAAIATFKPSTSNLGLTIARSGAAKQTENLCISGKCYLFDGSDDGIQINDNAVLDFAAADNFTVSGWVKRNGAASANTVIASKASGNLGTTYQGYKLYMDASGDFCFNTRDGTNAEDSACTSAVDFDDNVWHFVSGIKTGTSSITLYVDGQQRAQDSSIASTGSLANSGALYVGIDQDGSSNEWSGFIDEVKVFRDNSARTAAQVAADFNARSNPEGVSQQQGNNTQNLPNALSNGLVGYWKMDESSGNPTDSSGNSLTLTNNSSTAYATGKFGNAGTFVAASTDYFSAGSTISGVKTVSFWTNNASTTDEYINLIASTAYITSSSGTVSATGFTSPKIYINGVENGTLNASVWNHVVVTTETGINASAFEIGRANSSYNNGSIDDVRTYNRTFSNAEVSQLYNWAPAPIGYWKLDEGSGTTAYDNSGNTNDLTLTNSPTYANGKYGKGINLAGSDQQLTRPDDADFDFGTATSFSYQAWIKHNTASALEMIIDKYDATSGNGGFKLQMESDGDLTCGIDDDEASFPEDSATSTAATYDDNNWHHIACVKDGTSSLRLYIDGALIASDTSISSTGDFANADPLYIGIAEDGTSNDWVGQIDEPKIYNYARTPAQIIEDMNAGHPAPGSPVGSAVAYWKMDEGYSTTANDSNSSTGGSENLTLSTASWTSLGKFGKAWNGDGTIWMSRTTDADLEFSATDSFAVSMWFKSDSATNPANGIEYLMSDTTGNTDAGFGIYANTDGTICFGIDDDTTWGPDVASCSTTDLYDGTWHYLTAVRDTTADTIALYIDAASRDSDTDTTTATLDGDNTLYLGDFDGDNNGTAGTEEFAGDLDEVKIFRSALTADQIKLDMNRGSAQILGALSDNSTAGAPQAASQEYCIPGDSSTCTAPVAEWKMEEGTGTTTNDTSGGGATGTLTAGPTWNRGRFGKAVTFDGSDDFINTTDINAVDGLAAMSISLWFRQTALGTHNTFIAKADYATDDSWAMQTSGSSNSELGIFIFNHVSSDPGDNNVFTTDAGLVANNWYHLQMTYDGSQTNTSRVRFYLNGRLLNTNTTGTIPTTLTSASSTVKIGKFGGILNRFFAGTIDNVRIYNYARTHAQANWEYARGGPLGYWKMDECQGTTINDSAKVPGTALTGTLENATPGTCTTSGAWFNGVTGKRNYSLDFDGTDDVVTVPNSAYINMDCSIGQFCQASSFAAWINADSDGESDNGNIFSKSGNSFDVLNQSGSNLDLRAYINLDTTDPTVTVSNALTTGTWNHVVMTYDNTSKVVLVYVNGVLRGTSNTGSGGPFADAQSLSIGGGGENFDGKIDDFRVYNYVLLPGQVKQLYSEGAVNYRPVTGAP